MPETSALLIERGEVYAPAPSGPQSVLIVNDRIVRVGTCDRRALDALGLAYDVIDASDAFVVPGLIDPHEHLLGGSGEGGFAYQTPMLLAPEIARAGVTTVVGVLGVDTTMKTMAGLLARVKALSDEGLTTCMWSGGYNVPPTTIMSSIREDIMFIDECIGAGEIAISDERGLGQSTQELAKLVRDVHVGGVLTGKAGVTHFHVGDEPGRLAPLREIVEGWAVQPAWLYPTHVERSEALLDEAIALAKQGATVDMDTVDQDLAHWYRYYVDHGGPLDRLTVSSDADSNTPDIFFAQLCRLVVEHGEPLERVLALVTTNTARVLGLRNKGCITAGADADVVVLQKGTLAIREVVARGARMVVDGETIVHPRFLEKSSRRISIVGDRVARDGSDHSHE